eukprot:2089239-Amphidinium_carterae.1
MQDFAQLYEQYYGTPFKSDGIAISHESDAPISSDGIIHSLSASFLQKFFTPNGLPARCAVTAWSKLCFPEHHGKTPL